MTSAIIITKASQLVFIGFCAGIGSYAARKLTETLEERLLLLNRKKMNELVKEPVNA